MNARKPRFGPYGREGRMPKAAVCLIVVGFLCLLISLPMNAAACGWAGDGDSDDNDEGIWVDAEGNPIPDEEDSIDDPVAQTRIGNGYRTGNGAAKNYKEAVSWYYKAARQGFPAAQNNLAVMYEQGLGVSKDDSEAAKWYRKSAEGNDPRAQHSLGRMYREGRGVVRDPGEAVRWFREAAGQDHQGAFRDLGEMYWEGLGVARNEVRAYMWWKLGAGHGDEESGRLLSKAAEHMSSLSMEEAEKLAQEWMRK